VRLPARLVLLGLVGASLAPAARAAPIQEDPTPGDVQQFTGSPATPRRLKAAEPPRHPFMAPNGRSNLHDDGYQTDVYWSAGPLGRNMQVRSNAQFADCASVTFDSRGRIVTVCVGVEGPRLVLMDPQTLDVIGSFQLPPRIPGTGSIFTDFAGGGYFYLDNRDRAVVPTTTRHVFVMHVDDSGFSMERDYDLTGVVPLGDKIISALPDWSGRLWFASVNGVVGTLDQAGGAIHAKATGEPNGNSFAVDDQGGVYIVTDAAMYRFDAAPDGSPQVTWRQPYDNIGVQKPGQSQKGSGTTPTVIGRDLVAITDNADPMNVVVYRRAKSVSGRREVCRAPVFRKGASDTDQSLIALGSSLVVENNYGYSGPTATNSGATTEPGIERVDVDVKSGRCSKVWSSQEIAPSVVPKASTETGLVYTYTKPRRSDDTDAWYLTGLDFCTGRTVYRRLAGTGLGFNNNYAPVTLGPDGSAYVGTLGGLVRLNDSTRPIGPPSSAPAGCPASTRRKPRLKLRLRYRRGRTRQRKSCARNKVKARVIGRDRRLLRRADFYLGRRRVKVDRKRPFTVTFSDRHRGRAHNHVLGARVRLSDGRRARPRKRVRFCARG
jgi:hypothetical protein